MNYVYSTISNDVTYVDYVDSGVSGKMPIAGRKVLIKGGANVTNRNFITPIGVVTSVSDEDLEWLKDNYHFKEHLNGGYLKVEKREVSVEKVVKNMTKKDQSAAKVKEDFKNYRAKPKN